MNRRFKHKWLLACSVVPVVLLVFLVGRNVWWELRPFPNYPSLISHPDSRLTGTVVYFDSFPDNCVHVVAASGGESRKVACVEGEATAWLPDGRVQVTSYGIPEQSSDDKRIIIDVETGEPVPIATSPNPQWTESSAGEGPNGERVRSASRRGIFTLFLTDIGGERKLFSVKAPTSYTMRDPAWSPTGEWFVIKDGLDRLLTITTGATPSVRVLAKRAWGHAVTGLRVGIDPG